MTLLLALHAPAHAINIVLNFDAGQSDAPAFDPAGAGLIDMFEEAESFYQDVFEDTHTLTINFWYDDLDDSTLGLHSLVSQSGGRETVANIRIDTRVGLGGALRNWFIDPTPGSDTEFNMQQTLWRDISGTQQADWYSDFGVNVPDTFEVGYTGAATAAAAIGATDMLSVVMHEVGHALGMSASNTSTQGETGDGDYDFDSNFVFGQSLSVETANNSGDDNLNIAHLESGFALMNPGIGTSLRRLPSHSDLFAMAAGHSYLDLDVPRREFYGNTNWQNDGNWSGNTEPGSADDVYVRDAQGPGVVLTTGLTANGVAGNLFVSEGANVDTNAFKLDVSAAVIVSDLDSDIFINPGGELEAGSVTIQNQAEIEMTGGLLDANSLVIGAGTQIQSESGGAVTVDIASILINNGEVEAAGNSVMTLTSAAPNPWDLDGGGDGAVNALNGDIIFASGGLLDSFDGTMSVGAGHRIEIAAAWTNSTGAINLVGGVGTANRAELTGGAINFSGGSIVASGIAEVDAQMSFGSGFNGTVNGVDSELRLGNSTLDTITYNGGSFTGSTLVQNGDATVTANSTVTIDVGTFDFDGTTISDTTILAGARMDIIGGSIADAHDGNITINNGTLNVFTGFVLSFPGEGGGSGGIFIPNPWTMDGNLHFTAGGTLEGVLANLSGNVTTAGRGIIEAPIDFESDVVVTLSASTDILELRGTTNYRGGDYNGAGRLEHDGPIVVHANTTIGSGGLDRFGIFDWDGSAANDSVTTINPGVTFTLNVSAIEPGDATVDGYDNIANINSGTLAVNTGTVLDLGGGNLIFLPASWRMDGEMNLNNTGGGTPTLNGSPMVLHGALNTSGGLAEINARVIVNSGSVNVASGSTLQQDGSFTQQGGTTNVAAGGVMHMNGTTTFDSGGTADIDGVMELNANTSFNGGAFVGAGVLRQDGTATVDATTTLDVDTRFRGGSTTTIAGGTELRIGHLATVRNSATIDGDGVLHNLSGSTLTLEDSVEVDATLDNDGLLVIGASPGSAFVNEYAQGATGALEIEIGGLDAGDEHDLLKVDSADLAGALNVSLIDLGGGTYLPDPGDTFEIISGSSILGVFSSENLPGFVEGLWFQWDVLYDPTFVMLEVLSASLGGDFDEDGDVDGDDFLAWQSGFGINAGATHMDGDADGDGDVDGDDFLLWQSQFGSADGGGSGAVPEPSAIVLLTLALAAIGVRHSRSVA